MRSHVASRHHNQDDGSVLILVLIIGTLMAAASIMGLSVSSNATANSLDYTNTSQAELTANAGISQVLNQINSAPQSSGYPCTESGTLNSSGVSSVYQVSVEYFASSGSTTAETCGGSSGTSTTLGPSAPSPVKATVTSYGQDSIGSKTQSAEMKADFLISSMPGSLMGYAIFTDGTFDATNSNSLSPSANGVLPSVFAQNIICNGNVNNAADVLINGPASLGNCTIAGNFVAMGALSLGKSGNSIIEGNAASFNGGSSGIYIGGSSYVKGNAGAYNGSIQLYGGPSSGAIWGTATATGPKGSTTEGNIMAASAGTNFVDGVSYVSNSASYPSWGTSADWFRGGVSHQPVGGIPPSIPSFPNPPTISSSSQTITVPSTGGGTTGSCASFFTKSATTGTFLYDIANATSSSLVIDAPTCTIASGILFSTVNLNTNVTLEVANFTADGGNGGGTLSIQAASSLAPGASTPLSFTIIAGLSSPYTANNGCSGLGNTGTTVTIAGSGDVQTHNISLFIYTSGSVSYGNQTTITGQIFACSGVEQTGGDFSMTFSPISNSSLIWGNTSGAVINDEYLIEG